MRKCNCSGNCGPQSNGLNRREFIGLVGAGTAALLAGPAWGAFELPPDELARWRRELYAPAESRRYLSDRHTDARMHLGGIGTGNFEIGADGQLTTWQLFNTLRDGHVPLYFLVKAGATTRLLQTAGGPEWPRVKRIEMTGDYPLASLRFEDSALPVQIQLTAFTPFAPLDAAFSSMPLAAFVFAIKNPSPEAVTVSVAALVQNPVGYDAATENNSAVNPCFGHNINGVLRERGARGLYMRAQAAGNAVLDKPVTICATANLRPLQAPPPDRPGNLTLQVLDARAMPPQRPADPAHTVLWLEEPAANMSSSFLRAAREAVQAGATLVFAGKSMPLLEAYATWTGGKPIAQASQRSDLLFEDFEHGYDKWKVQGEAFGKEPAHGTLPNQQRVSGFLGSGLVNSFLNGDATTGRLISQPFTIQRRFIRFLIGGGSHPNTQMRLLVEDKVVRAASGKDNERLEPGLWDVAAFEGKTAHIEIVDEDKGGWGHINVDQIEFTDLPGDSEVMALLEELLPARFSAVRSSSNRPGGLPAVEFDNLVLQPGVMQSELPAPLPGPGKGPGLIIRALGQGKVVLVAGPILDPAHAGLSPQRQRAYTLLCGFVGARYFAPPGLHPKAPGFGTLALGVLGQNVTVQTAIADLDAAWKEFSSVGQFTRVESAQPVPPTGPGYTIYGAVAGSVSVPPGATVEVPFLLAWHYPNKYNGGQTWMGCYYATQWNDARAVIHAAASDFAALRSRTEGFRKSFYDSTLPYWLLDCVTANAAIIRHIGVVFRIANGEVYGWEGSNGCCTPTCTHVWGYEQTLSRLFPDLEKGMRHIDFMHQQRQDGGVNNRTDVPSPARPSGEHPFADGHASCILKAYREALNHPDDSFFKEYWPHIKGAVQYLIDRDAKAAGGQPAGILQDDQWNTYDEALHGVTTFISGYYLAALLAGEAWARRMGDTATADRFHGVFDKGRQKLIELCWNGEYFQQHLPDYLNREGEVGPGCMADQLIGQWWAHQLGLGYILPQENVLAALRAVFKYNFKSDLTGWQHAPRAFAGDKDKGLIICTWPKGGRPGHVMLYSDEVWTGIEYQVAAHMIYEGLVEEGLAIVKGARDRYDGVPRKPIPRNPWNEIECGGHYARAMSSWSLLLAFSGWNYDGPRRALRVAPRHITPEFKCPFTGPEGWGTLAQSGDGQNQRTQLSLQEGRFALAEISVKAQAAPPSATVEMEGNPVQSTLAFKDGHAVVSLKESVTLVAGQVLSLRLG